jgi:GNAT superfamily N-acetyltransferase
VIVDESPADAGVLAGYARVPIAFAVREVLACSPVRGGLGGLALAPCAVERPYVKDYDAADGGPSEWPARFGAAAVARWGVLAAYAPDAGGVRVGGAAVVHDDPDTDLLGGRRDLAVLWDLRVAPTHRGRGVGGALFAAAVAWARGRGVRRLTVETQNVNAHACRFYARQGCVLGAVDRSAYPGLPDEVRLLWHLDLTDRGAAENA